MTDKEWICPVCFEKIPYSKRVVLKKKDDLEKAICRKCNYKIFLKTVIYWLLFGIFVISFIINTTKFFRDLAFLQ